MTYSRKRIVKIFSILSIIIFSLFFLLVPISPIASGESNSGRIIKVGFYPLDYGQITNDDGSHSGYYYDYLEEIAQYTGWQYEFIDDNFSDCLDMLKKGDIDLMCGLNQSQERRSCLDFSVKSVFSQKYKLIVPNSRTDLTFQDCRSFDGLRVAVIKDDIQVSHLTEYFASHNITFESIPCLTEADMADAVSSGKADAIFTTSYDSHLQSKVIDYIAVDDLYFASPKNSGIIDGINDAQKKISIENPDFESYLYSKYITMNPQYGTPDFTKAELAYMKQHPVINVSYNSDWQPIEMSDTESEAYSGITAGMFNLISNYTHIDFEYMPYTDIDQALENIHNGKTEVIASVPYDFSWADKNRLSLSTPYLESSIVRVSKKSGSSRSPYIALTKQYCTFYSKDASTHKDVKRFDNLSGCLDSVMSGESMCTYMNDYAADYYMKNIKYSSLSVDNYIGHSISISIGISAESSPLLLSIINKSLLCISDDTRYTVILDNTGFENDNSLTNAIYSQPMLFLSVIIVFFLTVLTLIMILSRSRTKKNAQIKYLSEHDSLTGLFNRGTAKTMIEKQMSLSHTGTTPLLNTVLIIDLDHFKKINDTYGHPEGDLLLKRIAMILTACTKKEDIVGRMGGDEFVIFISGNPDISFASYIAEKICRQIEALKNEKSEWSMITASIGIAYDDTGTSNYEQLYSCADIALYNVKNDTRNSFQFYDMK